MKSITLLLFMALIAVPRGSSAQPPDAKPSAAADAVGKAHFQRGQRLSAAGNYAAAYREFAAGYAVTARPLFLFNMGEAARASGDVAKARDAYLEFLRVDPKSALAATARARLDELERAIGISPRPEPAEPPPAPPEAPHPEPVPLLPPSATPPSPPRGTAEGLPPERLVNGPRESESAPLWKKWPFWAVIGGVVVGGAVVFAATREGNACGTGCTQLNFR